MKKNYADMDPIEEIRAIREELNREFPTVDALFDYLRDNFPMKKTLAELPRKGQQAPTKTKTKANARPALRHRKAKVHT